MAYTPEQRKVQRKIVRIGRRRGEDRREILANLMTGGVESGWRNLSYGDRDSEGYRQERKQYYRNPRNLRAAINRWYDEANEFPDLRGGKLAQAVQQSAFPDRYKDYRDEALEILAREGGGGTRGRASTTTTTKRTPGVDNSALRQQLKLGYLDERGKPGALLDLAMQLQGAQDVPGRSVTRTRRSNGSDGPSGKRTAVRKGGGKIYEVFHDPLGEYFDSGKVVKGAIGGHGGHVHVAADPRVALRLGRAARRRGLTVRENPFFDPVDPVHTGGSLHYKSKRIRRKGGGLSKRKVGYALDVSGGTAEQRAEFARDMLWLAKRHG